MTVPCKLLVNGSSDDPAVFNAWWVANGRPFYVHPWHAWIKPGHGKTPPKPVGYGLTEDSDVWNLAYCMTSIHFGGG